LQLLRWDDQDTGAVDDLKAPLARIQGSLVGLEDIVGRKKTIAEVVNDDLIGIVGYAFQDLVAAQLHDNGDVSRRIVVHLDIPNGITGQQFDGVLRAQARRGILVHRIPNRRKRYFRHEPQPALALLSEPACAIACYCSIGPKPRSQR
jgi:hypothetical protein